MLRLKAALLAAIILLPLSNLRSHAATKADDQGVAIYKLIASQGVTGYEAGIRKTILDLLPEDVRKNVKEDELGNLILVVGQGPVSDVIAAPMDEVGYVVSEIRDDGFIRLNRVGRGMPSRLWDEFYYGQPIVIGTAKGLVPGVTACLSVHLQPGRVNPAASRTTNLDDLWVDVGASSRAQVAALGVRLLDPVSLRDRAIALAEGRFAGIAAGNRGACAALISVAGALAKTPPTSGSVVLAWLAQEWFGRKGSDRLSHEFQPERVIMLDSSRPTFPERGSDRSLGISGVLGGGPILARGSLLTSTAEKLRIPFQPVDSNLDKGLPGELKASYTGGPDWGNAKVEIAELPTFFNGSVVETVSETDVDRLAQILAGALEVNAPVQSGEAASDISELLPEGQTKLSQYPDGTLLKKLIETSSVSGDESRMRDAITALLPAWAKPRTDEGGNLIVEAGEGRPYKIFLAHMDEIGFRVTEIEENGRLKVEPRGFGYPKLYDGHLAMVHKSDGSDVPAVTLPPAGYTETENERRGERREGTEARRVQPDVLVYVGASDRAQVESLGIKTGDTVTIPKHFQLLADGRITARSIDDRNGCAALLAAVRAINPEKLKGKVSFVWTTREEVGLDGAKFFSDHLSDQPEYVFAIDTFVSSDSPLEEHRFADAPIGRGAVIRALDNSNVGRPDLVQKVLAMASARKIAIQYGVTGGGNDGAVYTRLGAYNIPLAWPLRYSHSPAEVIDLRDLQALSSLIEMLAMNFEVDNAEAAPVPRRAKPARKPK